MHYREWERRICYKVEDDGRRVMSEPEARKRIMETVQAPHMSAAEINRHMQEHGYPGFRLPEAPLPPEQQQERKELQQKLYEKMHRRANRLADIESALIPYARQERKKRVQELEQQDLDPRELNSRKNEFFAGRSDLHVRMLFVGPEDGPDWVKTDYQIGKDFEKDGVPRVMLDRVFEKLGELKLEDIAHKEQWSDEELVEHFDEIQDAAAYLDFFFNARNTWGIYGLTPSEDWIDLMEKYQPLLSEGSRLGERLGVIACPYYSEFDVDDPQAKAALRQLGVAKWSAGDDERLQAFEDLQDCFNSAERQPLEELTNEARNLLCKDAAKAERIRLKTNVEGTSSLGEGAFDAAKMEPIYRDVLSGEADTLEIYIRERPERSIRYPAEMARDMKYAHRKGALVYDAIKAGDDPEKLGPVAEKLGMTAQELVHRAQEDEVQVSTCVSREFTAQYVDAIRDRQAEEERTQSELDGLGTQMQEANKGFFIGSREFRQVMTDFRTVRALAQGRNVDHKRLTEACERLRESTEAYREKKQVEAESKTPSAVARRRMGFADDLAEFLDRKLTAEQRMDERRQRLQSPIGAEQRRRPDPAAVRRRLMEKRQAGADFARQPAGVQPVRQSVRGSGKRVPERDVPTVDPFEL